MILTCPSCGTQYAVKDGAIPPEGRQVRCAACKHSWHQEPEQTAAPAEPEAPLQLSDEVQPEPAPLERATEPEQGDEDESLAGATLIEPRSGPEAEERAYEEAVIDGAASGQVEEPAVEEEAVAEPEQVVADTAETDDGPVPAADWREPPSAEPVSDTFSPFARSFEEEPKRGAWRGILIALVLLIAAAALFWFFAPAELKAKLGIAQAGATPLQVLVTHQERRRLESGNELLTISGRVINPSPKEQDVPPIQAELKDGRGKVVYSWTIQPDTRSLAGGASASFNSAEVNVPAGGNQLAITLGAPSA